MSKAFEEDSLSAIASAHGVVWKGDFLQSLSEEESTAGYVKFNIPSPESPYDLNGEGVWGWLDPESIKLYEDDTYEGRLEAILANSPLNYGGLLGPGMAVTILCHGDSRPTLDPEWVREHFPEAFEPAPEETGEDEEDADEWRLGKDLSTYSSLLDGITFDDLILDLHCNLKRDQITLEAVRRELKKNILEGRLEDMWFLVEKNMDKIIKYSRDYYRDE